MTLARAWTRQLSGASGAVLIVPGTVVAAFAVLALSASVIATTGGYVGDAPTYQGHVVLLDRATGRISQVWNSVCSNRHYLIDPPAAAES